MIGVTNLRTLVPVPNAARSRGRFCWGPADTLLVPLYHEKAPGLAERNRGVRRMVPLADRPISVGFYCPSGIVPASTFGDRIFWWTRSGGAWCAPTPPTRIRTLSCGFAYSVLDPIRRQFGSHRNRFRAGARSPPSDRPHHRRQSHNLRALRGFGWGFW